MAKNPNKPRPGIVVKFSWATALEKMSAAGQARFIMAALHRGRDPPFEPDLSGLDIADQIRVETLWTVAAPTIDEDGRGWADGIVQRKYAGYCSAQQRAGQESMSFEEYKTWYETVQERDPEIFT